MNQKVSDEGGGPARQVTRRAESDSPAWLRDHSCLQPVRLHSVSRAHEFATTERGRPTAYLGVAESGLGQLIRAAYHVLGLRTFFTFNEKEVRAWTIHTGDTAARAAGTIHTDFERGFIKAETVNWEDLVKCGSVGHTREAGHYRIEGRDYVVKDGDVLLFKFNV